MTSRSFHRPRYRLVHQMPLHERFQKVRNWLPAEPKPIGPFCNAELRNEMEVWILIATLTLLTMLFVFFSLYHPLWQIPIYWPAGLANG